MNALRVDGFNRPSKTDLRETTRLGSLSLYAKNATPFYRLRPSCRPSVVFSSRLSADGLGFSSAKDMARSLLIDHSRGQLLPGSVSTTHPLQDARESAHRSSRWERGAIETSSPAVRRRFPLSAQRRSSALEASAMSRRELRCNRCGILLGVLDHMGISIHRGGMEASFPDANTARIVCYRCTEVNFFDIDVDDTKKGPTRRSA